ncbi:NAD(P)-dependent oxidoreductase [Winogradskyella tangerina]|uniref:NAD(P)-dependent oxidoreductase n=1 Tax=Winogradskyella tangerina TaxID=2023240 RepID=UPI000DBE7365|nr:NAD(P)-dependent oxidoreductase [Winogradskyella tangerina]
MKVLLTSTSFQDSSGNHQSFLKDQNWDVVKERGPLTEDQLLALNHNFDAIICGDDEYTEKVLTEYKKRGLKVLSKYGVGLDSVDLEAAKDLNITVCNCPGINVNTVAEHVVALLFLASKNLIPQHNLVQDGQWKRLVGNELNGKSIGIWGFGNIGRATAEKCAALGMKVNVLDLFYKDEVNPDYEICADAEELFEKSDIISLHLPLNRHTEGIVNYQLLKQSSNSSKILVNTSRGKLVDNAEIIKALKENNLGYYLADVLEKEPMIDNHPFLGNEKIIITPHIASRTYENIEKQGICAIKNVLKSL